MIEQLAALPKYAAYKDSGVEWLGEIPAHWITKKLKRVLSFKTGGTPSSHVASYYDGDEPWITISDLSGRFTDKFHTISKSGIKAANIPLVKSGSLLFSFKLSVGQVAFAHQNLYTNEAIAAFEPCGNVNLNYWYYAISQFLIRNAATNIYGAYILNQDLIKNALLVVPSYSEQTAIAAFLDRKTAQNDQAMAIKEQQIALLKEHKQILIQNAVTRGLDPNVAMRDSGVEWIGEIPSHWEVKRLKYVLDERNERSKTGEEPLFMVSQTHGLVVRSEFHEKAEVAQSNVDNKIVYKNDLVFNKLKAHLGVFFKSNLDFKGLVSPDYAVYHSNGLIDDLKYLEHLFRHPAYIGQFIIRATGIVEGLIRLYTGDLFQISIPVPPKQEQKAILDHIETQSVKIDQAIAIQQLQIEKLKEYKATLINHAVTGKIKVA